VTFLRTSAVALGVALLTPTLSHAFCVQPSVDSRLQVYCMSSLLAWTATNVESALALDYRLKREGYSRGIGLPNRVKRLTFSPYISPVLEYSSDINGGNPNRPLVLGSLSFFGDDAFFRKNGVVAGVGFGGSGRALYGEGKYLDFSMGVSYAHSPELDIGIARGFANICSKNDIGKNFYIDGCLSTSRLNRDLADETTTSTTLSVAKLFSESDKRFNQVSLGIRRLFEDEFQQNQVVVKMDTLHNGDFYTSLNASFGETVTNTLTMRYSLEYIVGTTLFSKPIATSVSYSFSDGGQLLGFSREETTKFFNIVYTIHPSVNISVGYSQIVSSINYFNESGAIFGVQFAPIRF